MTLVVPGYGAGAIALNMSMADVAAVLGKPDHHDDKRPWSNDVEWVYTTSGITTIFDQSGVCVAVMLHSRSDPVLGGTRLLDVAASVAWNALRRLDADATVHDNNNLRSMKLGVSIYAPDIRDEPSEPATSVLVFRPDYYESV